MTSTRPTDEYQEPPVPEGAAVLIDSIGPAAACLTQARDGDGLDQH